MWHLPEFQYFILRYLKNVKLLLPTNTTDSYREVIRSINLKFGTDSPLIAGLFLFKLVPSLKSRQRSFEFSLLPKTIAFTGGLSAMCSHRAENDWFLRYHWIEELLGKEKMHICLKLLLGSHENINFRIIKSLLMMKSQKLKYILNNCLLSSDLQRAYL